MRKQFTLMTMMLKDIRTSWLWYLILMLINPLSTLLFLSFMNSGSLDFNSYIIGSIIMVFGTGVYLSLGQSFSMYKYSGSLDYYLSTSISKESLIFTTVLRNIILSLPSLIILLAVGSIIYKANIYIGLPFFVSLVLVCFSLAFLGVLIGIKGKTMTITSIATQLSIPIFLYFAPVFVESQRLPATVSFISKFLPTTYAANSLRQALHYNSYSSDNLILLLIIIISFVIVNYFANWNLE